MCNRVNWSIRAGKQGEKRKKEKSFSQRIWNIKQIGKANKKN